MERYRNYSGRSGIVAYVYGLTEITIKFKGGVTYLYNYQSTGVSNVEQMKMLASTGRGLNTFINKYIGENYAHKSR